MEARTYYSITANSLYPVASVLMYRKIAFAYHPNIFNEKTRAYACGYLDFCLYDADGYSFADLLYEVQSRYKDITVTIMSEVRKEN